MRKNIQFYIVTLILLGTVLFFFLKIRGEINSYVELTFRHNTVYNGFQNLSKQLNNAAVLTPEMTKAGVKGLFYSDSLEILEQLSLLSSTVRDSVNRQIVQELDGAVRSELFWIIRSKVPDSIIANNSSKHVVSFQRISLLINRGISRTEFLIEYRKQQLTAMIRGLWIWMIAVLSVAGILFSITTIGFVRQWFERKRNKEKMNFHLPLSILLMITLIGRDNPERSRCGYARSYSTGSAINI